jgi:hypothetical protein
MDMEDLALELVLAMTDRGLVIFALIALCIFMLFQPPDETVKELIQNVISGALGMATGAYITRHKDDIVGTIITKKEEPTA